MKEGEKRKITEKKTRFEDGITYKGKEGKQIRQLEKWDGN